MNLSGYSLQYAISSLNLSICFITDSSERSTSLSLEPPDILRMSSRAIFNPLVLFLVVILRGAGRHAHVAHSLHEPLRLRVGLFQPGDVSLDESGYVRLVAEQVDGILLEVVYGDVYLVLRVLLGVRHLLYYTAIPLTELDQPADRVDKVRPVLLVLLICEPAGLPQGVKHLRQALVAQRVVRVERLVHLNGRLAQLLQRLLAVHRHVVLGTIAVVHALHAHPLLGGVRRAPLGEQVYPVLRRQVVVHGLLVLALQRVLLRLPVPRHRVRVRRPGVVLRLGYLARLKLLPQVQLALLVGLRDEPVELLVVAVGIAELAVLVHLHVAHVLAEHALGAEPSRVGLELPVRHGHPHALYVRDVVPLKDPKERVRVPVVHVLQEAVLAQVVPLAVLVAEELVQYLGPAALGAHLAYRGTHLPVTPFLTSDAQEQAMNMADRYLLISTDMGFVPSIWAPSLIMPLTVADAFWYRPSRKSNSSSVGILLLLPDGSPALLATGVVAVLA